MKGHFIAVFLMLSCGITLAQQIDSTTVNESVQKIGTPTTAKQDDETKQDSKSDKVMQQPTDTYKRNYHKSQWFAIGAKIGYNISLMHDKITDLYTIHTGLRHGGSTGIYMRLGTNVYCQPEVLYTFAIYDEKRDISGDTLPRAMQTHTIDVPVLLGYSAICTETFKLRIMIGPRFAFNVNTSDKYKAVLPVQKDKITCSMNKGRLGLDCGIGFDFWKVTLDLRYSMMEDIFKYQYLDTETNAWKKVNFLISTFNISLGYNIWGNNMPNRHKEKYDPTAYDFFRKNK